MTVINYCDRARTFSDFLKDYEASLKVRDKYEYMKAARLFAEYFDKRQIENPTLRNWNEFRGHVKYHYYEGTSFLIMPAKQMKCIDRAYRFYEYCCEALAATA